MKIRSGFVSNSSSSSYLITYTDDACPSCGIDTRTLIEIIGNNCDDGCECTRLRTIDDLITRYLEEIEWLKQEATNPPPKSLDIPQEIYTKTCMEEADMLSARLTRIADLKRASKKVQYIEISYSDRGVSYLFNILRNKGLLKIIVDDN